MTYMHSSHASGLDTIGSGRGRKHGTSSVEPFDRWYRYPAGFASDYAVKLLTNARVQPGRLVIDCFAGSGVTGTAARARGLDFAGIEAHPLIAELANLKMLPVGDPAKIIERANEIVRQASVEYGSQLEVQKIAQYEPTLVQRCFSEATLVELLRLRDAIKADDATDFYLHLKWALLATLRDVATVRVGWPYQRPNLSRSAPFKNPSQRFLQRVGMMADDLNTLPADTINGFVHVGDSRQPEAWLKVEPASASACISSPPYLNNYDYADATRLEVFFWGDVRTWAGLVREFRTDMITASTQQSSVRERDESLRAVAEFGTVGTEIEELSDQLATARRSRRRGKEYDQVLPPYFTGIASVLDHASRALVSGAPCLWLVGDSAPYGVYVDTPRLIGQIAEIRGFQIVEDITLRQRGGRWKTPADRHNVPLSERLISLRYSP